MSKTIRELVMEYFKKHPNKPICEYIEDDYYEWLKENYKTFFHSLSLGKTDWSWIKEKIEYHRNL